MAISVGKELVRCLDMSDFSLRSIRMKIQDRRQTPVSNENGRETNIDFEETEKKRANYYSTVKWRQSDACVTRSVGNVTSNKNRSSDLDTSVPLKHARGERGLGGEETVSLSHPWYRSRSGRSVRERPETVGTDPDIMKELLYYRKLLTKGPLLQKENLDLIQTIQKVKRLPASLRTKRDAPVQAEETLSPRQLQQLEDSFSAGASSSGVDINTECEQLEHAVERMKSNEDLLDSFREDFLKSVESNAGMQIRNEENSRFGEIDTEEDDGDKFMSEDRKLATTGGSKVELNLSSTTTDKVSLIPKTEHLTSESEVSSLESIPVDKKSQDLISTAIKRSLSAVSFFENGQAAGLEKRLSLDCSSSLTGFSVNRDISRVVKESSSENHPSSSATTHHPHDNSSSSQQQPQLVRGVSSDLYRTLDRQIEMERRIRTETMSTRVDSRGMFGEDFPPVDVSTPRNCFRPGSRQPHFQKNEHSFVTTSYRYGNPKEYGAPLASISGSNTSTNSTLQGSRVGITSREKQTRPLPQKNVRMRNGTSYSGGMERNRGYLYADAMPGATHAFQQRLIEIANLEGETIRYERTRKVKKKGKQDK